MHPNHPTEEELFHWAFSDEDWPDQNWDMFLVWYGRFDLYIKLADDYTCPQRQFFIDLLYYSIANKIQEFEQPKADNLLSSLLSMAKLVKSKEVRTWRHRVEQLKNGTLSYRREEWWSEPPI